MTTLNRVLVAVNFRSPRHAAFDRALALAQASGAELYALHAVPAYESFSSDGAERLARMNDLRERAEAAGVRLQTVEQHGDAADLIELHARAREVDLVVLGSELRRGRWRGRSPVAEAVVRRIAVPTLVVPGDEPTPPTAFRSAIPGSADAPREADLQRAA